MEEAQNKDIPKQKLSRKRSGHGVPSRKSRAVTGRQRGGKATHMAVENHMGSRPSQGCADPPSGAGRILCPSDSAASSTDIASRGMSNYSVAGEPGCNPPHQVTQASPQTDQNGHPRGSNSVGSSTVDGYGEDMSALMLLTEAALSRLASEMKAKSAADQEEAKKQTPTPTVVESSDAPQDKLISPTVNERTVKIVERKAIVVKPVMVLPAIVPRKRGQRSIMSCPKCGNEYNRADALRMHYASVHRKEKHFQCPDCGKNFGWKESVRRHRAAMHSGGDPKNCRPRRKPQLWHGQQLVPDNKLEEYNRQAKPLPPNVTARLL